MKQLIKIPAIAAMIVSLVFVVACTKKRDAALPYGADRDLLTISDYENRDYEIQTMELLKPANTGAKIKVKDDRRDDKSAVQNFDYVSYKANDPLKLTDDSLMLGRPNFKYGLRYVFEGKLLKVMKVSLPKDLSSDERASAQDAGNGKMMVPIVSYSVSYFSTDVSRNERNEKTSKLELLEQSAKSSASHFKVDLNSKTKASFIAKTTVLPADFFTGADGNSRDWYFSYTIVNQNYNESRGSLGSPNSHDKYGREASKIRAKKVEDKIIFYNLAIDERIEKTIESREENQATVVTLPADFVDFRFEESGQGTSVKEEANKDRAWDKRAYAELKLKDVKIPGVKLEISDVKDVQLDDGYFAFTVASDEAGGLIRFSFYNAKVYQENMAKQGAQAYKPKIYFPEDQKLFGYFTTSRETLGSYDRSKQASADQRTLINRFNPTRSEIEFRLNHDAPEWTEEIVKTAAAGWNASFKAAGVKFRIRVTDDQGKVLRGHTGDLRYSLINMFHEVDGGGPWGGYGPVLADPHTGEIIMATSNMNLTDRIEGMERTLNSYILSRKGALDEKYILGMPIPSLKFMMNAAQNTIQMIGFKLGLSTNKKITIYDPVSRTFKKNLQNVTQAGAKKVTLANQHLFENRYDLINGNIATQVAEICPQLKDYAEGLKDQKNKEDQELEIKLVKECSIALSKPIIVSVLLHEMGHNLGLRHNFYGSVDARNFYAPIKMKIGNKEVETKWESSTVMDYTPMNYENMTQPGTYDTAAIRWGYADQVESNDRKFVQVSPNAPTVPQVKQSMRKYMYCTDEDVDVVVRDPMCARSDIGTTPTEIVKHLIRSYDSSIAVHNHRHGNATSRDMNAMAFYRYEEFVMPMKRFYEQWRNILAAHAGPGNEYLEAFDTPEKYNQLIQDVQNPAKVGEAQAARNKEYKDASDLVFGFLSGIAFLPDYSCVAQRLINDHNTIQMFSFSKIQKNIFNATGETVTSCQDPSVVSYLGDKKQAKVLGEGGYAFENLYADLSTKQVSMATYQAVDKPEVLGMVSDRYLALVALVERTNMLYMSQSNAFAPNFVDDPSYRAMLNERILNRLTKGVGIHEIGLDKALQQELPEIISPSFEVEKPLLGEMFGMLKYGLSVPQKPVITNQRMEKYALVPMYYLRGDEDYECVMIDGYSYCATEQHSESKKLVKQLKQLENMKVAMKISEESVQKFLAMAKDLVPEKGQGSKLDISFLDKLFERIKAIEETEPALHQDYLILTNVFGTEINIWQQGVAKKMKKIQEDDISAKEAEARVANLKKIKIKDLVEKLGIEGKDYETLDQEIFEKRVRAYVGTLRAQAIAYDADPTELNAQADLILNALTGR